MHSVTLPPNATTSAANIGAATSAHGYITTCNTSMPPSPWATSRCILRNRSVWRHRFSIRIRVAGSPLADVASMDFKSDGHGASRRFGNDRQRASRSFASDRIIPSGKSLRSQPDVVVVAAAFEEDDDACDVRLREMAASAGRTRGGRRAREGAATCGQPNAAVAAMALGFVSRATAKAKDATDRTDDSSSQRRKNSFPPPARRASLTVQHSVRIRFTTHRPPISPIAPIARSGASSSSAR